MLPRQITRISPPWALYDESEPVREYKPPVAMALIEAVFIAELLGLVVIALVLLGVL